MWWCHDFFKMKERAQGSLQGLNPFLTKFEPRVIQNSSWLFQTSIYVLWFWNFNLLSKHCVQSNVPHIYILFMYLYSIPLKHNHGHWLYLKGLGIPKMYFNLIQSNFQFLFKLCIKPTVAKSQFG